MDAPIEPPLGMPSGPSTKLLEFDLEVNGIINNILGYKELHAWFDSGDGAKLKVLLNSSSRMMYLFEKRPFAACVELISIWVTSRIEALPSQNPSDPAMIATAMP